MSNIVTAFFAYLIDRVFGEFNFIKHPIIFIGELIRFFEKNFYKDSVLRGLFLVLFVLFIVSFVSYGIVSTLSYLHSSLNIIVTSFISSMFLAHRMLYDSVKNISTCHLIENKKIALSMLVSRDVQQMSESDINKASIETYAENLSDGVIAPLLYLLLFGLPGIILYKTINTMDSMVGYKNEKYEKYGKVAAILDDIVNYIPSRITAVLIMLLTNQKKIFAFYKDGKKHDSPNAGHPITAMALACDIKLGGDTYYFKKLKKKPYFGIGREEIKECDVTNALLIRSKIDITILTSLLFLYISS